MAQQGNTGVYSWPKTVFWRLIGDAMDEDLAQLTRDELIAEVKKLCSGIRTHRDSTTHELCWHHPQLRKPAFSSRLG
jgi:hypothetical protein